MFLNLVSNVLSIRSDYDFTTTSSSDEGSSAAALFFICCACLFWIAIYVFYSYCIAKIAEKTGHNENKIMAYIPIANNYLLTQIAGKDIMWFILLFIPFVNFIANIVIWMGISEKMNKGSVMGLLAGFPFTSWIGIPLLAFM